MLLRSRGAAFVVALLFLTGHPAPVTVGGVPPILVQPGAAT